MAKLYLKFEQAVLKELELAQAALTIGRLPDNNVQIDNLAVSGHHARVIWDDGHYVIEDLTSTNGTYVNNQRIQRAALKDGDSVLIGKHVLTFRETAEPRPEKPQTDKTMPVMQGLDATVMIGSKAARSMIDQHPAASATATPAAPAHDRVALLTVLDGKTDQNQYQLTGKLTAIGKSEMASIKLKGWFAPKVAAMITHREAKYFVAASEKDVKVKVNGEEISGQRELSEGDTIEVAGITMTFAYVE